MCFSWGGTLPEKPLQPSNISGRVIVMATVAWLVLASCLLNAVQSKPERGSIIYPKDEFPPESNCIRHSADKFQFCANSPTTDCPSLDLGHGSAFGHALLGEVFENKRIVWRCAGSLLAPQFVITSAHCITSLDNIKHVRITSSATETNEVKSTDVSINHTILHPAYHAKKLYFDVAIVRLNRSVTNFQPMFLPTSDLMNQTFYLTGWAKAQRNEYNVALDPMEMITNDKCSTFFHLPELRNGILANQVCGKIPEKSYIKPCTGSILRSLETTTHILVGIPSFTFGCTNERPLVFTNIVFFSPWIRTMVENFWQGDCGFPEKR
ncbi:serine protease 33-like [Phlebotomus argentipes]|uniref:serine protease 33-like n=1 Tax=Phlebotomus argentipes TaxID=94469 RepID=UPI002893507C|nr:serine protease 33-like [Phlebotomus argentipes]